MVDKVYLLVLKINEKLRFVIFVGKILVVLVFLIATYKNLKIKNDLIINVNRF